MSVKLNYNYFSCLANGLEDEGEKENQHSKEISELIDQFSGLEVRDNNYLFYKRGQLVREPLCLEGMKFSRNYFDTEEGVCLSKLYNTLGKIKGGVFNSLVQLQDKMLTDFQAGTCYGEALAFMYTYRPGVAGQTNWTRDDVRRAVFFQTLDNIGHHLSKALEAKKKKLENYIKQLTEQNAKLERATCRNSSKKQSQELQKRKTKILLELNTTSKKKATLEKQRVALSCVEDNLLMAEASFLENKRLCEVGFSDVDKQQFYSSHNETDFLNAVRAQIQKSCDDENASDILISFSMEQEEFNHCFLIQPKHTNPRLYDSLHGQVHYQSLQELVEDVIEMLFISFATHVRLTSYGPYYDI